MDLTQQHGYLHAGIVTTLLDTACGHTALSAMPAGKEVVSVEFKVNLAAPAVGVSYRAIGKMPGATAAPSRSVRASCSR